jgi:hypothetical protein
MGTLASALAAPACGQTAPDGPGYDLDWFTIDGGGSIALVGGIYEMGCTTGQPDAGVMSGGQFELSGGFWPGLIANAPCYANCDGSTTLPLLNVNDFVCFQNRFAAGDPYANCDGSTNPPVLNVNDFICFQAQFAAGCP